MLLFLYVFGVILAVCAACWSAVEDARRFQIPNIMPILALVGFVLTYGAVWWGTADHAGAGDLPFGGIGSHIGSTLFLLIITFGLFSIKVLGAGDAKLLPALGIWLMPLSGLPLFIWYTSLCGGALGVATLLLKKYKPIKNPHPGTWIAAAQAGENRVPYGLAIGAGFLLVLLQLGYLDIMSVNKLFENGG